MKRDKIPDRRALEKKSANLSKMLRDRSEIDGLSK